MIRAVATAGGGDASHGMLHCPINIAPIRVIGAPSAALFSPSLPVSQNSYLWSNIDLLSPVSSKLQIFIWSLEARDIFLAALCPGEGASDEARAVAR
jgi:hypothetical protein